MSFEIKVVLVVFIVVCSAGDAGSGKFAALYAWGGKYSTYLMKYLDAIWYEAVNNLKREEDYASNLLKLLPKNYNNPSNLCTIFVPSNLRTILIGTKLSENLPTSTADLLVLFLGLAAGIFLIVGVLSSAGICIVAGLLAFFALVWFRLGSLIVSISKYWLLSHKNVGPEKKATILEQQQLSFREFIVTERPTATELEQALYLAQERTDVSEDIWSKLLDDLEASKNRPQPNDQLIADLQHSDWTKRFIARHTLISVGGEVVPLLNGITWSDTTYSNIIWMLENIGIETTRELSDHASDLLCSRCLVTFQKHTAALSFRRAIDFWGCRVCLQSKDFVENPRELVVVLDPSLTELHYQEDQTLVGNWLKLKFLFDFDWVKIINATDEQVERFAVQVGNDTDEIRSKKYKNMRCVIEPTCNLSENTIRILRSTFGQVECV